MSKVNYPNIRSTLFSNLPELSTLWFDRHFNREFLKKWNVYGTDAEDLSWLKSKFIAPLLRLFGEYIGTGKEKYLALYLDERLRYAPHRLSRKDRARFFQELIEQDEAELLWCFDTDSKEHAALKEILREAHAPLLDAGQKEQLEVLALGDCLMNEARIFLSQKCRALGFDADLRSMYFSATENAELSCDSAIEYLQKNKVDAIVISFFTFDGMRSFNRLMLEHKELSDSEVKSRIDDIMKSIREFLLALRESTQAPFLVHTAGGLPLSNVRKHIPVIRAISYKKQAILNKINAALAEVLHNVPNCIRVYEQSIVREHGLRELSKNIVPRWLRKDAFFHTSAFGEYIAQEYAEILDAFRRLRTTKVLLVDFDNTLWHGVMADGAVVHYIDKQVLLRELKEAGVLLVAVSKNTEENIRWDEMALKPEDFALRKINWNPKAQSIEETAAELNLGMESFVLIDDNPAERALVEKAHPKIGLLDATVQKNWDDLRLMLQFPNTSQTEEARTRTAMYQAQVKRQSVVKTSESYAQGMESLNLALTFRKASKSDSSRLYELINRTNQFNTTTIRYSKAEIDLYREHSKKAIWVAELEDKFSKLGIIGAIMTSQNDEQWLSIESFVMSCRAMGYGVERQMLFELAKAQGATIKGMLGRYVESAKNAPCKDLYKSCGFDQVSQTEWSFSLGENRAIKAVPWISVKH